MHVHVQLVMFDTLTASPWDVMQQTDVHLLADWFSSLIPVQTGIANVRIRLYTIFLLHFSDFFDQAKQLFAQSSRLWLPVEETTTAQRHQSIMLPRPF